MLREASVRQWQKMSGDAGPLSRVCAQCLRRILSPPTRSGSRHSQHTARRLYSSVSASVEKTSEVPAQPLLEVDLGSFGTYWDIETPRTGQLNYARRFFETQNPAFYFATAKFRDFPISSTPEVAFLGRSNVGKSSLLNALLNRSTSKIAHVSSKPGRTRTMNAIGIGGSGGGTRRRETEPNSKTRVMENWIGPGGLVVVDMPGYGFASQQTWGEEIMKYLRGRKQLRRTFLLIDAEHGLKRTDEQLLRQLREHGVQYQIILSKIDKVVRPLTGSLSHERLEKQSAALTNVCEKIRAKIQAAGLGFPAAPAAVLACSAEKSFAGGRKVGIDGIRWAVLQAAGLGQLRTGKQTIPDMGLL